MQPRPIPMDYRCPACGWRGELWQQQVEVHRHLAAELRKVSDFTCTLDERLLCKQCRPTPAPGEADLRHLEGDPGYRVEVTHARRKVRRVIWLSSPDLQDLESTLLGRRDARYLGPKPVSKRDARAVEPGLQAWWRQLRAELDEGQPDLGRELGMAPLTLDFGKLGKQPIARPLHLLNPTKRAAVFQLQGGILTVDAAGQPNAEYIPYHLACTPTVETARRDFNAFAVPAGDRLVLEIIAQPWARREQLRRIELWAGPERAEKKYLGEVQLIHTP